MIAIDLVLRIAVAFLKDMNLEEFKKLVYETEYLLADINAFENEKIPKDSNQTAKLYHDVSSEFVIHNPRYEAEILLCFILSLTRTQLHIQHKREISDFDKQRYFKILAMRKNGTPLEYIMNRASFYGLELYVDNCVLIPRNETEILVEKALKLIKEKDIKHFIEIGTGSGAISISLLKNIESIHAIATDISKEALHIALHNAKQLEVNDRCDFIESNLLESNYLPNNFKIPLLISNPPYISRHYQLNQEVLCEPHIALFGGEKGDEILIKLIGQARALSIPYLICEMGYDQKESMQNILNKVGYEAEFYKDYAGFDRGFVATLKNM